MPLINTKQVLIIGFSTIVALMVLIAVIATNQMSLMFKSIDHIVKNNHAKTTLISTMIVVARDRTISLQKMLRFKDPFDRDEEWMRFNGYGAKFVRARKQYVELGMSEVEESVLNAQGALTNNIAPVQVKIAQLVIKGDLEEAEKLLATVALPGQDRVLVQLHSILSLLEDESNLIVLNISDQLNNTKQYLMLIITTILFGSLLISIVVIRRISATEMSLSQEKERAEVTLQSLGDAVITTDEKGRVTQMNPVAERLTGWQLRDAKEEPLENIFRIFNASTQEPIESPAVKVIDSGETIFLNNHTTLISKDGTKYHIADSAAPIRADGDILGMVLVFNDITEQYRLREIAAKNKRDLQAILDNSPAVIYVKDMQGCFTFINREFEKTFGIKCKDIIGKTQHEVSPEEPAKLIQVKDNAALEAGHAIETEEVMSHNNEDYTYSTTRFPLFDEENNIYAVCGISTDITDRKRQEEQIRRSRKMDALGMLTGGIAHDYNNMLGIVIGYADMLDEHLEDNPDLQKHVQNILHAAERGVKLTKKLLAFTRHSFHDASLININTLLLDQRLILEKTLTARITLTFNLKDNLWQAWLDSDDFEDAIINMTINAMHAITDNGQLTLSTRNEQLNELDAHRLHLEAGDYILLSVSDTGKGMTAATREKVFDPFFSTKGEQGTGLGLSQVYGFMQRSGGAIQVYSELGHGSHFTLYFPRSDKLESDLQVITNRQSQNLQGSETLLVVDDEGDLAQLTHDILSAQGYRVFIANNGEQALLLLEKEDIDLIISDVIMPNMDGYQLASRVQQDYPHIKIQMVSGFADDRNALVNDSLHLKQLYKPVASNILLEHVRRLLDEDK